MPSGTRRPVVRPGATPAAWAAAGLLVALPLVVDPDGYLGALPVKWLLLVTVLPVGVALAAPPLARVPGRGAWALLLGVLALASVFGVAPLTSLLGAPQRSFGLLSWCLLGVAYLFGVGVGRREVDRWLVGRGAILGGLAVSLVALAEQFGLDPLGVASSATDRSQGTWGSAELLGGYLVLVIPLAVALAVDVRRPTSWRVVGAVAGAAGLGAIVSSGTRGAWVGLAAAALVGLAPRLRRLGWRAVPVVVAVGVAAVVVLSTARNDDLRRGTAEGRLEQWRLTVDVVADRPLLGSGPDTYRLVFPRAIDAAFEREHAAGVVNDRAHDLVLDTSVSAGLVGLAALVWLLVSVGRALPTARSGVLGPAVVAALAGYLVHLLFAFQDPALDALAWLLAGTAVGAAVPPVRRAGTGASSVAVLVSGLVAVTGFAWAARGVVADRRLERGVVAAAEGDLRAAVEHLRSAADLEPERAQHWEALARTTRLAAQQAQDPELARRSVEAADRALDLLPDDPTFELERAESLLAAGRLGDAASAFDRLLGGDYPQSYRAHLGAGTVAALMGEFGVAEQRWRSAASLVADDPGPLLNLGQLYEQSGRHDDAVGAYREALERDPGNEPARRALARLGSE